MYPSRKNCGRSLTSKESFRHLYQRCILHVQFNVERKKTSFWQKNQNFGRFGTLYEVVSEFSNNILARLSTLEPSFIVKHSEKLLFSWKNMILFWFSPLGEKLPSILQNGSQNCFLGVRMNVSRKKNLWKDFKIFINSELRAKNFWTFGKSFRQTYPYQNSLLLVQSELLRKKYLKVVSIWYHLRKLSIFVFGFWPKFFTFCQYCDLDVHKNVSNFFLQQVFFFYHFLALSRNFFDFWPSFFFGAITESAFNVYGGKIL